MGCAPSSTAASDVQLTVASTPGSAEAIFFPDAAMPCRNYIQGRECRRRNCTFAHSETSLVKLLRELDRVKTSLEICVFTITCNEIADAIEAAAKRNVSVRIITDDEQMKSQGSDIVRLAKVTNIKVRHDGDPTSHMHHKFAILDGDTLINGSFNWTRHAVISNRENVVITRAAPLLTKAFRDEFNKMWTAYINQPVGSK